MASSTTAADAGRGGQPATGSAGTDSSPSTPRGGDDPTPWPLRIAIVTITKDDFAGIKKTIASVDQQDFLRYEHIIVDGGSRTDVSDLLVSWRDRDPKRRILVENPPAGIYPAMNTGIRRTSAPIIVILNGGDEFLSGTLRRVNDHYQEHGWRWAYGGLEDRDEDGRVIGETVFTPFSRRAFRAGLEWIPHPAAYVTRDLHDQVGLYREDLGIGADQEFFLRASLVAEPGQLPGKLAVMEPGGVSSQEGRLSREVSWHRMRVASKTAFGGGSATDLLVTALLLGRRLILSIGRRLRRIAPVSKSHGIGPST